MDTLKDLIIRYREKGILVDTNILLLYFVGQVDPNIISRFNRTEQFTIEDYTVLCNLLKYFQKIVSTPNILTEISNLSQQIRDPARSKLFDNFSNQIHVIEEHYIKSKVAANNDNFEKFGLTDIVIIELVAGRFLLLTDDFKLSQYLLKKTIDVINFNHIRVAGWE